MPKKKPFFEDENFVIEGRKFDFKKSLFGSLGVAVDGSFPSVRKSVSCKTKVAETCAKSCLVLI